jgi:hypothetical protein
MRRILLATPSMAALLAAAVAVSCGSQSSSQNGAGDGGGGGDDGGGGAGMDTGTGGPGADSGGTGTGSDGGHGGTADSGGGKGSDGGSTGGDGGALVVPPQVPAGWKLALDDEFDGTTLGSAWGVGTNLTSFTDNGVTYWNPYQSQEAEYLTGSMVKVENSNLVLSTEASSAVTGPSYGTKNYIAGYVTSYGKFAFQYGYIEFRMEMPDVAAGSMTGLWPALWLLNSTYANSDEIDVLESYGGDQTAIQMTAQPSNQVNATITVGGYHVLGVLHQQSTIAFYVDNKLQKSFNQSMSSEMAILMGMQLGSSAFGWLPGPMPTNWPGGINGPMTADFKVDWVHVWTP